jgi:RNA polymerase sigma-70 factor (ECF subfamily)
MYDGALPHVYGYLLARCGSATVAEDLTAETFLAAVAATRRLDAGPLTILEAILKEVPCPRC